MTPKQGRNEPCVCGSGRKFKKCCGAGPLASAPSRAELDELSNLLARARYLDLERKAQQLLTQHPTSGLLWKVLGVSLWQQGRDALAALRKAAQFLPDDAEAHGNLGNALRAAGLLEEALRSHRRAVSLQTDHAESHNNLGSVLLDLGHIDEAEASFEQAIRHKPGFALAHSNLGTVYALTNRGAEADTSCRRALEIEPTLTVALVQLAELRAGSGSFLEAESLLKTAIAVDPDMPEAWAGLVRWRKMDRDVAWVSAAGRIAGQRLPPRREAPLRYALGKYHDDVRDFDLAFHHYRLANELCRRHGPSYDRASMSRSVDDIVATQDAAWLNRAKDHDNPSRRPVFIVGMWRSGTSLVEQILASHPEVFGAGELPFWTEAVEQRTDRAKQYLSLLDGLDQHASRVIDKMCANFFTLGQIHAALPQARIIHVRRNPLDTCLSIYFQHFQNTHPFANDLEDLQHYYGEYLRLMTHWRTVLPQDAIFELDYERLIEHQEDETRALLRFIDLPWDSRCLRFEKTPRVVSTLSKWQVRQGISGGSVARWRHYEKFIGPLRRLAGPRSDVATT